MPDQRARHRGTDRARTPPEGKHDDCTEVVGRTMKRRDDQSGHEPRHDPSNERFGRATTPSLVVLAVGMPAWHGAATPLRRLSDAFALFMAQLSWRQLT